MEKRELSRTVKVGEREYRIKKMDARLATYIAFQLASFLPKVDEENVAITEASIKMSKRDFFALQNDLLSHCFFVMPADTKGDVCVIDEKNQFVSDDLQYSPKVVLSLCAQSLAFNVMDFFDASFLKESAEAMKTILPVLTKK